MAKLLPVCPTYVFQQSGHANLYNPTHECMSEVCCLFINSFCTVLLVRNAIFMLVFLNRLVMTVVSLPVQVNVANFCIGECVCVCVHVCSRCCRCLFSSYVGGWL